MQWQDRRHGTDEDLENALIDKFSARHLHPLRDILDDDPLPLNQYYGEDSQSFSNKSRVAEQIDPKYEDTIAQLLELQATQFRSSQLNPTDRSSITGRSSAVLTERFAK